MYEQSQLRPLAKPGSFAGCLLFAKLRENSDERLKLEPTTQPTTAPGPDITPLRADLPKTGKSQCTERSDRGDATDWLESLDRIYRVVNKI